MVTDVCSCDGHTLVGRVNVNGIDHGAIWEDDILIDVGSPQDEQSATLIAIARGNIVGEGYFHTFAEHTNIEAERWSPIGGWVRMGQTEDGVLNVNAEGTAIGLFSVIWPNGSNVTMDILPGLGIPAAINDSGVIAGECAGVNVQSPPCEWTSSDGWVPIGTETTVAMTGINNSNMAVGITYDADRSFATLWRPHE